MRSVGSRPSWHPRFVVCSPFRIESALPEANSFISKCQPFCNIRRRFLAGDSRIVTAVTAVNRSARAGPGLTQRNLVSTLEQSPERGDTAATRFFWRPRRLASETDELTNGDRVPTGHERAWDADAIRNEERQPWPRASGPFSPTTGAGRGCTGSGCGCGPGPAGRSCRRKVPFVDCVIRRRV